MSNYRHCPRAIQCILIIVILFSGFWARASASLCRTQLVNKTYREEVQRQWGYLNDIKADKNKALKMKLRRLIRGIQNHADANGVLLETDPQDSNVLLLKVLPKAELQKAHPLNRFSSRLYDLDKVRVEINPLKLKVDDAGALFDEDTNRLTLAIDDVLDLRSDSFVGHELRHAYSTRLERKGIEHVFMGTIKRKPNTPILQATYPDLFSFDELPAYYYQVISLLRESRIDPTSVVTAKQFLKYGLELLAHFTGTEIMVPTKMTYKIEEKYQTVVLETEHYFLDFNFLEKNSRSEQELKDLSYIRLQELVLRAKTMRSQFETAQVMLDQSLPLKEVIDFLGSKRDVIDPKIVYSLEN